MFGGYDVCILKASVAMRRYTISKLIGDEVAIYLALRERLDIAEATIAIMNMWHLPRHLYLAIIIILPSHERT